MRKLQFFSVAVGALAVSALSSAAAHVTPPRIDAGQVQRPEPGRGPPLGREQSNIWMPVDAIAATTETARRAAMVQRIRQEVALRGSSIGSLPVDRVLAAMTRIDRERFVPKDIARSVYLPTSLPIGHDQTISDAYIVTVMIAAAGVRRRDRVLDIGTGSGYQAALLGELVRRVTSIEIVPELAKEASDRLRRLGYRNVVVQQGDGRLGDWADAPYDAIFVAAGSTAVPAALHDQLAPGGRLVIPIGPTALQEQLLLITRGTKGHDTTCTLGSAVFVPLTGGDGNRSRTNEQPATAWPFCFGHPVT